MRSLLADEDFRLSLWRRVREFAVPPSMIDSATARRHAGDWAGACAAARVDVDLDLRSVARIHGRELATEVRADLRHLAPDLLRWHMPRTAPDGLLRPGLTIALARYGVAVPEGGAAVPEGGAAVHLVARTPPAWADAGQRISLALWDGSGAAVAACPYPHPHPDRRFRLDLHRYLWDAREADELRTRSGADRTHTGGPADAHPDPLLAALERRGCAVDRWPAEAGILLRARRRTGGRVAVRLGAKHRLVLDLAPGGADPASAPPRMAVARGSRSAVALPVLPDASTWVPPDLELLRAGLIEVDGLHPLVAAALVPDHSPPDERRTSDPAGRPRLVECRGALHRVGLVDGVLAALDHDPVEIRREELLAALTGDPLPCLQVIDQAHRQPECLTDIRARLDHGDTAGALSAVEGLLGPDALLRSGALRDELEAAALRRITHGLFRAGLAGFGPGPTRPDPRRTRDRRSHPRRATHR